MKIHPDIVIIPYQEKFIENFKNINYEWIEKYFHVTELDQQAFNNPQNEILDKGGHIYLASYQNKIIGSVVLEKITQKKYALTRMGVTKGYQRKNIGQLLIETAINKSKELELETLVLYTNQVLISALNLYTKNNFKFVPLDSVPYTRATIKMQLNL